MLGVVLWAPLRGIASPVPAPAGSSAVDISGPTTESREELLKALGFDPKSPLPPAVKNDTEGLIRFKRSCDLGRSAECFNLGMRLRGYCNEDALGDSTDAMIQQKKQRCDSDDIKACVDLGLRLNRYCDAKQTCKGVDDNKVRECRTKARQQVSVCDQLRYRDFSKFCEVFQKTEQRVKTVADQLGYSPKIVRSKDQVVVKLSRYLVIRRIYLRGNWPLFEAEVLKHVSFRPGQRLPRGKALALAVTRQRKRMKRFLAREGYFRGNMVVSPSKPDPKGRVDLEIRLFKGKSFKVGTVSVVHRWPPANLLTKSNTVKWKAALSDAEIAKIFRHRLGLIRLAFDTEKFKEDEENLTKRYHELGYPGVRVKATYKVDHDLPSHKAVQISVRISERKQISVRYRGNRSITESDLNEKLTLAGEGAYDSYELAQSAKQLRNLYQSRGFVQAQVRFTRKVGTFKDRITFHVNEGPRLRIKAVEFVGNKAISDKDLSGVVKTKPFPWLGYFSLGEGGYVTDLQLKQDVERIRVFYYSLGYNRTKVLAELAPARIYFGKPMALAPAISAGRANKGRSYVRFTVDEGPRRIVDEVVIQAAAYEPVMTARASGRDSASAPGQSSQPTSAPTSSPTSAPTSMPSEGEKPGPGNLDGEMEEVELGKPLDDGSPTSLPMMKAPSPKNSEENAEEETDGIPTMEVEEDQGEEEVELSAPKDQPGGRPPNEVRERAGSAPPGQGPGNYVEPKLSFAKETLIKLLKLQPGRPYDPTLLGEDIRKITVFYGERGYPYVDVRRFESTEGGKVKLTLTIDEGTKARYGPIFIRGNFRTRESVIRSCLGFKKGDTFNRKYERDAETCLRNLEIFNTVNIDLPGLRHKLESLAVVIRLEERYDDWGEIEVGVGGSTDNLFFASLGYSWRNLFGLGHNIELKGEGGPELQRLNATYAIPRLFGSSFSFEVEGFVRNEATERLGDLFTAGASTSISKELIPDLKLYVSYEFRRTQRKEDLYRASGPADEGNETTQIAVSAGFGTGLVYDRRNNPLSPSSGFRFAGSAFFASEYLGGTANFVKFNVNGQGFIPLPWGIVIALGVRYDHGFPLGRAVILPEVERFFAGGDTTIRGFEEDTAFANRVVTSMAPFGDVSLYQLVPMGGNIRILANAEIQIPILKKDVLLPFPILGAVFFDNGVVTNSLEKMKASDFRHSFGFALRLDTGFGFTSFEFAFPFPSDREIGDPDWRFHFNFGFIL